MSKLVRFGVECRGRLDIQPFSISSTPRHLEWAMGAGWSANAGGEEEVLVLEGKEKLAAYST